MVAYKKLLACAGFIFVCFSAPLEALNLLPRRPLYVHVHKRKNLPHICDKCATKDFLASIGVISLAAGAIYAVKACYDHFYWTDKRTEQWEYSKITTIRNRYFFLDAIKTVPLNSAAIEQLSDFGLNTKNSSLDSVLKAAAPLHSTVDSMNKDFMTLCTIIQGCGKRHCVYSRLVDDALAEARMLENIASSICQTKEYKKEAVEIEKITNSRLSIKLQQAAIMQNAHHHYYDEIVIIEED